MINGGAGEEAMLSEGSLRLARIVNETCDALGKNAVSSSPFFLVEVAIGMAVLGSSGQQEGRAAE